MYCSSLSSFLLLFFLPCDFFFKKSDMSVIGRSLSAYKMDGCCIECDKPYRLKHLLKGFVLGPFFSYGRETLLVAMSGASQLRIALVSILR